MPIPQSVAVLATAGVSCWNGFSLIGNPSTGPAYFVHCDSTMRSETDERRAVAMYNGLPSSIKKNPQSFDRVLKPRLQSYSDSCTTAGLSDEWEGWDERQMNEDIALMFCNVDDEDSLEECSYRYPFLTHIMVGLRQIQRACMNSEYWTAPWKRAMEKLKD